jgi:uncharacterized membrane protein (DUF485 family)
MTKQEIFIDLLAAGTAIAVGEIFGLVGLVIMFVLIAIYLSRKSSV